MTGCVLRVSGANTQIDEFLRRSGLVPTIVFREGEASYRGTRRTSGFNLILSGADGESLAVQVRESADFLRANRDALDLLNQLEFDAPIVDFGIYDLANYDCPWPSYRLPADFVRLAGELGFAIEISFYGAPPPD